MSDDPTFGFILSKFYKKMRGAPIIDDDDWKEANRVFVKDLLRMIDIIRLSNESYIKKRKEFRQLKKFIDNSISEISEVLQGNSVMADELRANMIGNVSEVYQRLGNNINVFKPPVEAVVTPVATAATAEVIPDRTTQNTNVKIGGGFGGLVDRFRKMIIPSRFEIATPISEAVRVATPDRTTPRVMPLITDAVPVPPSEQIPSQRYIRAGRISVSNIGGGAPPGMYIGGGATRDEESKQGP